MDIELDIDLIIKYLGEPKQNTYTEYIWQCPICADKGGDTHKDNLKFNKHKKILYCFADPSHSRLLLSDIYKSEWEEIKSNNSSCFYGNNTKPEVKETQSNEKIDVYNEEVQQQLKYKALVCNEALLNSTHLLSLLKETRGIDQDTVAETYMGFDEENKYWTLPTVKYTTESEVILLGFEYRPYDFNKQGIRREKNLPTGLAMINDYNPDTTKFLAIVEGYFDGYTLLQYLRERGLLDQYHIATCSNGVNGLQKQIKSVNFLKYERIYLFIDNDEVSRPIAEKIIEEYPFIQNYVLRCGCKDFNDHYIKCIINKNVF